MIKEVTALHWLQQAIAPLEHALEYTQNGTTDNTLREALTAVRQAEEAMLIDIQTEIHERIDL